MSEELKKKSSKALIWSSITEIIAKLITPIVNMVLARILTPQAFGAVATITMVITFAEIFTDAGFQKYIVQHDFSSDEELDRGTNVAFWTNFAVSFFAVSIITFFRDNIATIVGSPGLGDAIAVASSVIILVAFSSIQMARFKRIFDFKTLFFVRMGSSIIPLVVTVPLAFVFRNYWALVFGTLAVNLFNAIALTVKSKWKPKFFYDFKILKKMFSFTFWTLLESILIWLTVNIDIFMVGQVLDNYYLGLYKTSMTTINSYMALVTAAVTPVLFSTLSRYQNDDSAFRETYWQFFRSSATILFPMSLGILVFRNFVTELLLGDQWLEASGFIGVWGGVTGFAILFGNFSSEVYRSKGYPKLSMLAQFLQIVFLIPTVLIGLKFDFGTLCMIRAFARVYGVIINIIIMRFVYKFNIRDFIKNSFPPIASSLIMSVIGVIVCGLSNDVIVQVLGVLVCIVVYFLFLFFAFPHTKKDLLFFVKNI